MTARRGSDATRVSVYVTSRESRDGKYKTDAVSRRVELSEIGYATAAFGISHNEVRQVAYGRLGGR